MGDHRLPERVMSGGMENAGKRRPGGSIENGRAAGQRIVGCLASQRTGASPP